MDIRWARLFRASSLNKTKNIYININDAFLIKKRQKKQNKIMCDSLQRKNNPLRAFNQIGP